MATTDLSGALGRTQTARPTAPLPPAALDALRSLELKLTLPADIVRAVTRFETASVRSAELGEIMNSRDLTVAEFNALDDCTKTIAASVATLQAAGRLDLIAPADPAIVEKVRVFLGYRPGWAPRTELGETATSLTVWSQNELNALFDRVGGTVSMRQASRSTSGGDITWTATELTLTVEVPGVGPVRITTDIEDNPGSGYRTDLPVVAVARYRTAALHCQTLAASGDYDGCLAAQDEMRLCQCQLAAAGRLDLIRNGRQAR